MMNQRGRGGLPSKYILLTLSIICVLVLFVSYATNFSGGPLQTVANYIFVPMQKGLNYVGDSISVNNKDAKTKQELIAENEKLTKENEELRTSLTNVQLQQAELERLQNLYQLSSNSSDYKTTGAHVIAKGTSNWFNTFTIDKGSNDGIQLNMNVIAGSGLVGLVTEVGKNYAVVRTIIDDTNNISAMVLSTGDNCIISGTLEGMSQNNMIDLSNLEDSDNKVKEGDSVVTSNISDKYLPGILIGYVNSISDSSNGLTKTGKITPVVDFHHLQEVLVILQVKETSDS